MTEDEPGSPGTGNQLSGTKGQKTLLIIAGIVALVVIIVAAGILIFFGNAGSSASPVVPPMTPIPTATGVPVAESTAETPIPTIETTQPLQPVDFSLVPSDMTNCGLTCRQLDATITNTGSETAHGVCITLAIHNSKNAVIAVNGNPEFRQCIGDLPGGESKTEPITINADCGAFGSLCIGETLTLETTATSDEKTVKFPDQQVAV